MKTAILFISYLAATFATFASVGEAPAKLVAPDGAALDRFGTALAASETYLIVGSPRDDDHGSASGSVYLFDALTKEPLYKITPQDGAAGDEFGAALAIFQNFALIGARFDDDNGTNSGSAYLYDLTTGELVVKLSGENPGDQFGKAVALNSQRLAVTAWLADPNGESSGQAYLFDTAGKLLKSLLPVNGRPFDQFGASAHFDQSHLIIGAPFEDSSAPDTGAAYLFDLQGNLIQKFTGDDRPGDVFGTSVAVRDGRALVGATLADSSVENSGAAFYFDIEAGELIAKITALQPAQDDRFGACVDLDQNHLLIGSPLADSDQNETGRIDLYHSHSQDHLRELRAPDASVADFFGTACALLPHAALATSVQDDDLGSSSGSAYSLTLSQPSYRLQMSSTPSGLLLTWSGGSETSDILISEDLQTWSLLREAVTGNQWPVPAELDLRRAFFKVTPSVQ